MNHLPADDSYETISCLIRFQKAVHSKMSSATIVW